MIYEQDSIIISLAPLMYMIRLPCWFMMHDIRLREEEKGKLLRISI